MRSMIVGLATMLMAVAAFAAAETQFSAEKFKADQAAGKPIVVHISAPWCPTCKAQHQAIKSITAKPEFADITVYEVDFDSQQDVVNSFSARAQSTIIGFRGDKETSRIVGDASPAGVESVFASTAAK